MDANLIAQLAMRQSKVLTAERVSVQRIMDAEVAYTIRFWVYGN